MWVTVYIHNKTKAFYDTYTLGHAAINISKDAWRTNLCKSGKYDG